MAYEKTNWSSGDVITAEKLNHIEDGIANDKEFIVTIAEIPNSGGEGFNANKSVNEIKTAYENGYNVKGMIEFVEGSDMTFDGFLELIRFGEEIIEGVSYPYAVFRGWGQRLSNAYDGSQTFSGFAFYAVNVSDEGCSVGVSTIS